MHDFGAETVLTSTEESWGHDITLTIDADVVPKGAPSEVTGEITGAFRDFDNRNGVFLLCESDGKHHTVDIPLDVISGYRISELPEHWDEEDQSRLEGDRECFFEMVRDDVSWLMNDADLNLSDACFIDCEETVPTYADLKRHEIWQRSCPAIRRWYESPEIFLIVGAAATLDLDIALRADRLLGAFENLNGMTGSPIAAAALAQVPADIEGLRLAARAVTYGGIQPMRAILFSLLATGDNFGPETAAALSAIEEGFCDRHARRNRSGIFH